MPAAAESYAPAAAELPPGPQQLRREYLAVLDAAKLAAQSRGRRAVVAYAAFAAATLAVCAVLLWLTWTRQQNPNVLGISAVALCYVLMGVERFLTSLVYWPPHQRSAFRERMEIGGLAERMEAGLLVSSPLLAAQLKNNPAVLRRIAERGRLGELLSAFYYPNTFLSAGQPPVFWKQSYIYLFYCGQLALGLLFVILLYRGQPGAAALLGVAGWMLLLSAPLAFARAFAHGGLVAGEMEAYLRRKWTAAGQAAAVGQDDALSLADVERGYRFALIVNDLDAQLQPQVAREYAPHSIRRLIPPLLVLVVLTGLSFIYYSLPLLLFALALIFGILLGEHWLSSDEKVYQRRVHQWLRFSDISMRLAMQELSLEQFAQYAPGLDQRLQNQFLASAPAPFKRGLRAVLWVFVASASFVESGLRPLMRKENFYAWIVAPALLLGMGAGVLTFVVLDFSVVGEAFWQNMAAAGLAFTTFFMPALYGYFRVVRRRWIAALEFVAYLRELAAGEELTGAD